ncbi:hypothetical protein ACVWZ4_001275 [Bradyrhizobium sp. USDA 4472]
MSLRGGCTDVNTKSSKREDGTDPRAIKACRSVVFDSTAERGLFTPSALLGMPAVSATDLLFFEDIKAAAACRLVCRPITAPLPSAGGAPAGRIAPSGAIEAKARKTIAFVAERKNETDMLETFLFRWVHGDVAGLLSRRAVEITPIQQHRACDTDLAMTRTEMHDTRDQCSIRLEEGARGRSGRR